ncbi:MAG: hypothetical protein V5A64_00090 [Candidatus Thermoplasmatota archaeon]
MVENKNTNLTNVAEKEIDLLGRHVEVLKTVQKHGPIGIIRLSKMTDQPQHMIRYSLRKLENDGVIEPSPNGAMVTNKAAETLESLEDSIDELTTTMKNLKSKLK